MIHGAAHARDVPDVPDPEVEPLTAERRAAIVAKRDRRRGHGRAAGGAEDEDPRPVLALPADAHAAAEAALTALARINDPPVLFRTEAGAVEVLATPDGDATARPVRGCIGWRRVTGERFRCVRAGEKPQPLDALPRAVADLLADWPPVKVPFPELRGIIRAPVMAPDGTVLDRDGYHAPTGLFVALGGLRVNVPDRPTADDVAAAVALLDELFIDFPFAADADRANAFALLVTLFARPMVDGPTPLFAPTAPAPGSGKTLLARTEAAVAGARVADVKIAPRNDHETDKAILAALRDLPGFVLIDNLPERGVIDSPALARALTSTVVNGRILGVSQNVTVENRAVWVATGNNPRLSTELTNRSVEIRLIPTCENPRELPPSEFRHSLPGWAVEHRGDLASAALTLCRAWVVAGRPPGDVALGSFESFAAVVGGIVAYAGIKGLLANRRARVADLDPDRAAWGDLVAEWAARHDTDPISVADVRKIADDLGDEVTGALYGTAETDAARRQKAARALQSRLDRVFGDCRIVRGPKNTRTKTNTFCLKRVGKGGRP